MILYGKKSIRETTLARQISLAEVINDKHHMFG
jgi:hypothetical protein